MTMVEIARRLGICQSAVTRSSLRGEKIAEESQLKLPVASYRESSTVRNADFFWICSLTPQQATGNALAFSVQARIMLNSTKS
jgi:hypothetical protein